jgi:hypothetical protein
MPISTTARRLTSREEVIYLVAEFFLKHIDQVSSVDLVSLLTKFLQWILLAFTYWLICNIYIYIYKKQHQVKGLITYICTKHVQSKTKLCKRHTKKHCWSKGTK